MMMLAIIVGIRPLQDSAQHRREDDHGDAACEPEPRAEGEVVTAQLPGGEAEIEIVAVRYA